ncbi:MAG: PEP-CTERM sorting domain-containing protein [Spartobacteria bacterium]|nr:PEP-CTERM sorting domain-containing protein [Spartobacteria bacterium]
MGVTHAGVENHPEQEESKMKWLGVCVIGCVLASGVQANLLSNPGFETEGVSSWNAADWLNESDIGRMDWAQYSGSYGMAGYGDADGKWGYIAQTVSTSYDAANPIYRFTIWGMAEENFSSSGNEVYMKVTFKENGSDLGDFTQNIYADFTANTDWNQHVMQVTNTAWTSANQVEVLFGYGQTVNDLAGNCGLRVDDASMIQIPEPTSVLLLALGSVGIVVFRIQRNRR